jgi:hypothetical protein
MVICTVDEVDSFFNFHPNLQNILMEESLIKKHYQQNQTFLLQPLYADFYLFPKSCIL